MQKKIINIVNRDYPPYRGITGESAAELAAYLVDAGFVVNVIHVKSSFRGKGSAAPVCGITHTVPSIYNGDNRMLRLLANLLTGYLLVRKARSIYCDAFIVMTDPSLLNMWASLLLGRKRKWILWAMDLYPEAFAAWDLVGEKSLLYRVSKKLTLKHAPYSVIALGHEQGKFIKQRYADDAMSMVYLPCGICHSAVSLPPPEWHKDDGRVCLAYMGNLGAQHSLEFLLSMLSNMDASRFRFVLSVYGYGSKVKAIIDYAKFREGVILVPHVDYGHFKYIDIHLASLLPRCVHISVPSKSVSAVCNGGALLYCGDVVSDNWTMLMDAAWRISCGSSLEDDVRCFYREFTFASLELRKRNAQRIASALLLQKQQAFAQIAQQCGGEHA